MTRTIEGAPDSHPSEDEPPSHLPGPAPAEPACLPPDEGLVETAGETWYVIPDVDRMPPFLMSVVSDGDRWMFVSSAGGLTAGRGDATGALFPYETDDRLHRSAGTAGTATAIRTAGDPEGRVWRPFRDRPGPGGWRRLAKSATGDAVLFEAHDPALGLRFRHRWSSTTGFGFVRRATLVNDGTRPIRIDLVDGLVGILPYGVDPSLHQSMSNLTNAYKRSEVLDAPGRPAVFSLESGVVDRPEPAEVLRASTVWATGLEDASVSVDPETLAAFEAGLGSDSVGLLTGRPGAYLLSSSVELAPGASRTWYLVGDVAQDQVAVTNLLHLLASGTDMANELEASMTAATRSLVEIMAPADALQHTGDRIATVHQFANVTYNVMRGGVPVTGYRISLDDFERFVRGRNRRVADGHRDLFRSLPAEIDRSTLLGRITASGDVDLVRLGLEYLPFAFSRRHGDPSRPWNAFSIRVRDDEGRPILYYEGNWRDIFQNWEATCASFPRYLTGVISVFVNASTPDGYNPYRITRDGIDWEVPEPDDPWSNIGYWGDHQIVYLLRLLEQADRYLPGEVGRILGARLFTYADVPYRIASYDDLVRDPKATIRYDRDAAARSERRVTEIGGDGRLVWRDDQEILHVTLAEKLLVPALAKLSNFVPGGGIWMNTQRPEWNDANNALVGFGLSMVTLFQLRRYLRHLGSLVGESGMEEIELSAEVAAWLHAITDALRAVRPDAADPDGRNRKALLDRLGHAFSDYRERVYRDGLSDPVPVSIRHVDALCETAIDHLDATIRAATRPDGLHHAYNLIHFAADGSAATVEHLPEMLEGQVAVLSSGVLTPEEQADVVEALFAGSLYRPDQASFVLYPPRRLPSFLEKNVVPAESIASNPLLSALADAGDRSVIGTDADGRVRFHPSFSNGGDLSAALDALSADPAWTRLVSEHRSDTLAVYEQVFRHHTYTGRSGSMYAYEGIGSIYWHMVAKLLVAVQEAAFDAAASGADPSTVRRLVDGYWRIRSGLGFNKPAAEFGAIPTDPYSHTPAHAGAQQPGMTGLVKEELLTRPAEMGIRVDGGEIRFDPMFLRGAELVEEPEEWRILDLDLEPRVLQVPGGSLGATLCQVPVIVSATDAEPRVELHRADGTTETLAGLRVDPGHSAAVFSRSGEIASIRAFVPDASIG